MDVMLEIVKILAIHKGYVYNSLTRVESPLYMIFFRCEILVVISLMISKKCLIVTRIDNIRM